MTLCQVLGKRAPSAMLLSGTDTAKLLDSFGCAKHAAALRKSLKDMEAEGWAPAKEDLEADAASKERLSKPKRKKPAADTNAPVKPPGPVFRTGMIILRLISLTSKVKCLTSKVQVWAF